MEQYKHYYPLTILESHLDTFGHVNNAVYLQIFEEARWDFITANGYGLEKIKETGLGPVILDIHLKFRRELKLRQKITIETSLTSYNKKLYVIHQEIRDHAQQVCCVADFTFGLFNIHERKLVLLTPAWLKAISAQS